MGVLLSSLVGGIWLGWFVLALPAVGADATPAQQSDSPAGIDGVLLLRNKNLVSGQIARFGERYRVVEPGAEFFIPAGQVWRCCRSREDAYAFLRSTAGRLLARDHLELAQWCLRHDLLPQAARELLDARTLDPNLPTLPLLERQLRQQLRLDAAREQPDRDEAATGRGQGAADVSPMPGTQPPRHDAQSLTPVDLSRGVRATFARQIQPMLVGSCTTSGCHTPGSSERLQLDRLALAGGGHAELTRRNLAATLAELNSLQPRDSPLVEHARRQHGTADASSTPLRRRQAALLIQWVRAALGVDFPTATEASIESPAEEQPRVEMVVPAAYETTREDKRDEAVKAPRDRFDPAVFNGQ